MTAANTVDGEAYLYAGEYKDEDVERPVYQACQACKGTGEREKPISLREFADLLDHATAMEPDWAELAKEKPISQFQDSRECGWYLINHIIYRNHEALFHTGGRFFDFHRKEKPMKKLTQEQLAVVHHPLDQHARVLAVAGSGKSTTMAHRIKHLVNHRCSPWCHPGLDVQCPGTQAVHRSPG